MKNYKRLTRRRADGRWDFADNFAGFYNPKLETMAGRLCDLEDKIENGTLRELPKIGQTLYGVIPWRKEVWEITIDKIEVFSDRIVVFDPYDNDYVLNNCAFYTEAEAQKALKEFKR
jgi:hypothetical protein